MAAARGSARACSNLGLCCHSLGGSRSLSVRTILCDRAGVASDGVETVPPRDARHRISRSPAPLLPAPPSSDAQPATAKRQRLSKDGGDGLSHADFISFGKSQAIRNLWAEYTGTLRQRNRQNASWLGQGPVNKRNRNYYYRKAVWYREIARQYELNGSNIDSALNAVQAFADAFFLSGGGGWDAAETALRRLTPAEDTEAARLTGVYESI